MDLGGEGRLAPWGRAMGVSGRRLSRLESAGLGGDWSWQIGVRGGVFLLSGSVFRGRRGSGSCGGYCLDSRKVEVFWGWKSVAFSILVYNRRRWVVGAVVRYLWSQGEVLHAAMMQA